MPTLPFLPTADGEPSARARRSRVGSSKNSVNSSRRRGAGQDHASPRRPPASLRRRRRPNSLQLQQRRFRVAVVAKLPAQPLLAVLKLVCRGQQPPISKMIRSASPLLRFSFSAPDSSLYGMSVIAPPKPQRRPHHILADFDYFGVDQLVGRDTSRMSVGKIPSPHPADEHPSR